MCKGSGTKEYRFSCPVCGKPIGESSLPTIEGVFPEGLLSHRIGCIVNSKVLVKHHFEHCHDEEIGLFLDGYPSLVSIIKAEFDSSGDCIHFDILEVRSAEDGG